MFLSVKRLFSNTCLQSFQFIKLSKNMSSEINTLIMEQPIINDEKEKATKRPASEEINDDTAKQIKTQTFDRIKRKNYAMLMGYLGINYTGMQRNRGMKTIEEELLMALRKIDLITEEAFDTMQTIKFQRAARTDKFVSAVGQIVNLKLPDNPSKEEINKHLPQDIRVFAIKRVTKGFNSKNMCDARTYSYTIPTFSFATQKIEYENLAEVEFEQRVEDHSKINGKHCYEYRITEDKLNKLTEMLKKFEGTHNFHNFTSKIRPLDPRARRFIVSYTCGKPFLENGVEFITLEVKGQSFMMHQIRKMIGTVIGILRESATEEIFERCFTDMRIELPRAPGLGLILKTVHMDYYNQRYGKDGIHEKLDWIECEEEMNTFFKDQILAHIVKTEIQEKNMIEWFAKMPFHRFGEKREDDDKEDEKETALNKKTQEKIIN